ASFYLMHALMPVKDTDKAKYHIQPRLVTPRQAAPALLADKDLCILVNVALQSDGKAGTETLGQEFIDGLASFVRAGHGLILFAGDHVSPELYNQILHQQHGLLPQRLAEKFGPDNKPVQLDRNSAATQFFSLYQTDENYKTINGIEIRRYLEMAETSEPNRNSATVQVILRYSNGRPAILTRRVDAGEVMLVTTTADLTWTDWPLWRGMYLPFLDLTLNHLLHGQTQNYNLTAGQPLNWYPPEREGNRHYVLIHPDGRRVRLGMPDMVNGRPYLTATDTPRAGVYRMVPADGPETAGTPFAVVPDPRETENLEAMTESQLDDRLGFKTIHLTPGGDLSVISGGERWNREWTPWLLAAVLAVAVGESLLAWYCGRAR
ncbi:MAG TPA: hypothetical protein VGY77_01620, partial [Gemmataceae bacterium]|nr:hypothetical protein [Gemmataceae bacterium]